MSIRFEHIVRDANIVPKDLTGMAWDIWVENFILQAISDSIEHHRQEEPNEVG